MAFDAYEVAMQIIRELRGPLERLEQVDRDLARQMRRAASSVAQNVGEGARRQGKDRLHLWRIAAGSNAEVRAGLRVAVEWGHLDRGALAQADGLLDREQAMLWRLTRPSASQRSPDLAE